MPGIARPATAVPATSPATNSPLSGRAPRAIFAIIVHFVSQECARNARRRHERTNRGKGLSGSRVNLQCLGKCPVYSGLTVAHKRSAGDCRRFSSRNAIGLLTASDVDVPDIAAIIDVASPRQVGRGMVTVTERAIGADAVRAVAVIGIAPAARETVDAHSPAGRSLSSDAEDAPVAGGRNADQRSEDRAEAGAVGQPVLNRRRTLRRGHARVHAVGAVTVVAVIAVIAVIRIILRRGGHRSGNRGDPGRAGQHSGHHTHGSYPPSIRLEPLGIRTLRKRPWGGAHPVPGAARRDSLNASLTDRQSEPKSLTSQHFTSPQGALLWYKSTRGLKGRNAMESSFGNWRSAAIGLGLTVAIVGTGLALAFW